VSLPYEEVVNGQDGTIVHWDIKKDTNTNITDFSILNDENDLIAANPDSLINDILSLRYTVANNNEGVLAQLYHYGAPLSHLNSNSNPLVSTRGRP